MTTEKFESISSKTKTTQRMATKADFERAKYRASIVNIVKKQADFELIELLFDDKPKAYQCLLSYKSLTQLLSRQGIQSLDELEQALTNQVLE